MKRHLILALFFAAAVIIPSSAADRIVLATGEWDPYTSESLPGKGFFSEVVTAAFQAANVSVEYKFYPWKRCESELDAGNVAGVFPYVLNSERTAKYSFSDIVAYSKGKFFYSKTKHAGGIPYNSYADLLKYNIGGTIGYWYEGDFRKANLKVEYVASDELNVKKLQGGRVDLVPMDELVGQQLVKKIYGADAGKVGTISKPLNQSALYIMFSKSNPEAKKASVKFNEGLAVIKKNGIYKSILAKYGLSD